jgi:hypothetical protein
VPAAKRQVDPVAHIFEDSQLQVSASEADMTLGERDSRCSGGILLNP